ncbi:MAG: hypothetical protein DHS20C05_21990 [Hyphococcus sp.]|nr:MAG: hypothetical protein DHS20C05_21990 [Marinicaulis sp.]
MLSRVAFIGYAVFLIGYSTYKYSVAAPPSFSPEYAQSVAILVLLTGVAPFLLAYLLLKLSRMNRFGASVVGLLLGLVFCVIGYGAFWWFFIAPGGQAPALYEVALRGVGWGMLQGGLAAIAANH